MAPIRKIVLASLAIFASSFTAAQPMKREEENTKYFSEPGGSLARMHYDSRYFVDEISYDDHRFVLRDLIRSYLATIDSHSKETWLAHGTLLGWWWNGQIMPWDYDLDVQVSHTTMQWLADNLNNTQHTVNATNNSGSPIKKTYLLDINPHHSEIDTGDGQNVIDGRWIDTSNGMFIDLTVLRERNKNAPGVWSCKNYHNYESQDLWPMRVTEFEGVPAKVPYSFEKILTDEYTGNALINEEFHDHVWDRDIKEWVQKNPDDAKKQRQDAIERKKVELRAQGRL